MGKVVAVTDTLGASGSFVLHDFVALFLKAGRSVVVVSASTPRDSVVAVSKRLGVPSASVVPPRLAMVDVGSLVAPSVSGRDSAVGVARAIDEAVSGGGLSEGGTGVVVFDDVTHLADLLGSDADALRVWHHCKVLCRRSGVCVVGLVHVDADVEVAPGDGVAVHPVPCEPRLSSALCSEADVTVSVVALETGQSSDVHGTIVVTLQPCFGVEPASPSQAHFKVLDSAVRVFPVGAGRV